MWKVELLYNGKVKHVCQFNASLIAEWRKQAQECKTGEYTLRARKVD